MVEIECLKWIIIGDNNILIGGNEIFRIQLVEFEYGN